MHTRQKITDTQGTGDHRRHPDEREDRKPRPKPRSRTAASALTGIGLAYERFLELPVWVVVLVLWVIGVALLGAGALVLYAAGWTLVG